MEAMRREVQSVVIEWLGDDALPLYDDCENIDLFDEYGLELRDAVELLVELRERLGVDLPVGELRREDMSTLAKIEALVEGRSSRATDSKQ